MAKPLTHRPRRRAGAFRVARALRCLALALTYGAACAVQAAECPVDIHAAYLTAKARGWTFYCVPGPGMGGGLVVSPGQGIGCDFRNPAVPIGAGFGDAQFFESHPAGNGLRNGWSIGTVEFSGAQWQRLNNPKARILARAVGMIRTNHTYSFRLTRLVLKRPDGQCSAAIEEAF